MVRCGIEDIEHRPGSWQQLHTRSARSSGGRGQTISDLEIKASLAVAQGLGLVAESARPISTSGRTVLLLEPRSVVANVEVFTELPRYAREVELSKHVQHRRGPVVAALLRADPGPHVRDNWVISFWEYTPSEVTADALETSAAPAYAELRYRLNDFSGYLPYYLEPIEACREALTRSQLKRPQPGFHLVRQALEAAVSLEVPASDLFVLHGDPHGRNLTASSGEVLWLDLKSACLGPLEWDLTALPPEGHFAPPNHDRFARLLSVRSACVVVWCLEKPRPQLHDLEAIQFHLQRLARTPVTSDGGWV